MRAYLDNAHVDIDRHAVMQAPKGKRVAAAPAAVRKSKADAKPVNPLYEKRKKIFGTSVPVQRCNRSCLCYKQVLTHVAHASQKLKC